MPYINKGAKISYSPYVDELIDLLDKGTFHGKICSGDVVYIFYKILKEIYGDGNFEQRSNALKVLEATKLEYYRRIIAPYEDKKILENGDIE